MSDHTPAGDLELQADPADGFMALYADACGALNRLRDAARDLTCPGGDPTGEHADAVRADLRERYDLVLGDADLFLGYAADTRNALREFLGAEFYRDCDCDDES